MSRPVDDTTRMVMDAAGGDDYAAERLVPLIYNELRELAGAVRHRERAGHTLQATALVNEAYLKLVNQDELDLNGKSHFKAIAARAMQQVLVDHAKRRDAAKRGGDWKQVALEEATGFLKVEGADFSHITEALARLAEHDARLSRAVELRFFGGLTNAEVAEMLGVSVSTVEADWRVARAWLRRDLGSREIL